MREIDRLAYYATRFNSIEINTTFHAIPAQKTVRRWKKVTPSDFRFSIKFPRDVTHKFPGCLTKGGTFETIKQFFDVIQELDEKLAVILMQFPPDFSSRDHLTLLKFLDDISCPTRLVLEFRNDTWWTRATARALRERNIGWAATDLGKYPAVSDVPMIGQLGSFGLCRIISTADFLYARWIGDQHQFPEHFGEYFDSTPRINWWYERLMCVMKAYRNVRNVYAFFDNDFSGHVPTAARRFADKVNLPLFYERPSTFDQPSLFPVQNA